MQITTHSANINPNLAMCFTLQRYKFSSKSQLLIVIIFFALRCVLPCKGTNFQANHNVLWKTLLSSVDVFYLAKVQIFKQITTAIVMFYWLTGCVLPCKGTNFQANHNVISFGCWSCRDVFYLAKVQIFKQITTISNNKVK